MEKRLWLAIILSFFVIMAWGRLFPVLETPESEDSQIVDVKRDMEDSGSEYPSFQKADEPFLSVREFEEKKYLIQGKKLSAEGTNIDGKLFNFNILEYGSGLPLVVSMNFRGVEGREYTPVYRDDSIISYVSNYDDIEIRKRYEVTDNYLIKSKIRIENKGSSPLRLEDLGVGFILDIDRMDKKYDNRRDQGLLEYSIAFADKVKRKTNANRFSSKDEEKRLNNVEWIGFRNRYYAAILKPQFNVRGYQTKMFNSNKLRVEILPEEIFVDTGAFVEYNYVFYVGPQKSEILKEYGMGFERIFVFFRMEILDTISKWILYTMNFIQKHVRSWGLAIIIIALIINGLTYPLTLRSMLSMKKMQAIQPKLNKIREQYKNNPEKLNKEMMTLYKENKINPLGGCLPLFLQMPIFIGIYQVLWRSVYFKGSGFLWIKDLSEPDRLFLFPTDFPIIGNEFNVLPIIMVVLMFIQQKFSQRNMSVVDPSQAVQQKMMLFIFPAFLGFIFYSFSSGISLYFTIFYLISTLTQWRLSKVTVS